MAEIQQYRQWPDLVKMITGLVMRIQNLERARRLGNASLDGGELTLRGGDLVVRNENNEPVLELKHGASPTITMIPDYGLDYYLANLFAWESAGQGAAFQASIMQSDGVTQDGGKLLLMRDGVYLSHQPASGNEAYFCISPYLGRNEDLHFKGRWLVNLAIDATDAITFGTSSISAGFGAATISFPFTFSTAPFVTYSILSAVGPVSHNLTAVTTADFTVGWSGTTAKTIYWQAWRQ